MSLTALSFQISQAYRTPEELTYTVDWQAVRSAFDALFVGSEGETELPEGVTLDGILNPSDDTDEVLEKARKFNRRLGNDLASASQGHAFVNGKHFDLDDVSDSVPL